MGYKTPLNDIKIHPTLQHHQYLIVEIEWICVNDRNPHHYTKMKW